MNRPTRVLQLVGSPTNDAFRELSELYARGCVEALRDFAAYEFAFAHVAPGDVWRFPASLESEAIAAARPHAFAEAVATIAATACDAALPQMFCRRGMTELRALLDLLGIPYLGNGPLVMAIAADKAKAKAIVAAAGVDVPRSQLLRPGDQPEIDVPAVVKPNDADNSEGVTLVADARDYDAAVREAFRHADEVLVEAYVPLGREVRCGVIERAGRLVCLPLEEYYVDESARPIRRKTDKLKRDGNGGLTLGAKTKSESWIVLQDDPIVPAVWAAARRCYAALGSRQYNLFDFRVDPRGRPWFLEAGPYCSFSPQSVIVTMMEAAGTPLARFFADSISDLLSHSEYSCPRR